MRIHALIPAAGGGVRFGAQSPKQYALLDGRPVLVHAIERLAAGLPLHRTYVAVAHDDHRIDHAVAGLAHVTVLRCGGATRAQTVRNALAALAAQVAVADDDWIVVHDAVRPCVDTASLTRLMAELANDPTGGLLAIPVACTLKRVDENRRIVGTEPRDGLWQAQTPQMFRHGVLAQAFARPGIERMTDEAEVVEASGRHPRVVVGSENNLKITWPDDLVLASAILEAEAAEMRTG